MSERCVLATAIDAIDTGAPAVYPTDACSGSSEEYEDMDRHDGVRLTHPHHRHDLRGVRGAQAGVREAESQSGRKQRG